jgi:hypothetical protein
MKKWNINLKCFPKELEPFPIENSLLLEEVALSTWNFSYSS